MVERVKDGDELVGYIYYCVYVTKLSPVSDALLEIDSQYIIYIL